MPRLFPIRGLWLAGGVGLVCLAVQTSGLAATDSSKAEVARKKPAHHSSTPAASSKHQSSGQGTASSVTGQGKHSRGKTKHAKKRGQRAIDSDRARQIQKALIREHYLEGEPSGTWDSATQAAMQRYQSDQGWQTKTIPDSRALIQLGLGPNHDHLLNPESAMTTAPLPASAKGEAKPVSVEPSTTPAGKTPAADTPQ